MKKLFFIAVLVIAGMFQYALAMEEDGSVLKFYAGEITTLAVSSPKRIVIGNPKVADVSDVTKSEMTISAKTPGKTTLTFWDNFGEHAYEIKVFAEDIMDLKSRIDSLILALGMPDVYSRAAEEEGKVLILGGVRSAKERERLFTALSDFSEKIMDLIEIKEDETVIEIDVQVLELQKDATRTLGFTMPGSVTLTEVDGSPAFDLEPPRGPGAKFSTFFKVTSFTRDAFSFTLDALEQEGKARILSRPRLSCQSGKEADLMVGGEKPIFTTQVAALGGGSGTSVEYKEYGIKLNIKPTVAKGDRIKLGLKVEVSEVGTVETIGNPNAPTASAYPILKRSTSTELYLNNEQTLGIGGLIKQKEEEDVRKNAFLGDIPVLGMLFRNRTVKSGGGNGERGNSELFIVLTPKIVARPERISPPTTPIGDQKAQATITEKVPVSEPVIPTERYAMVIQQRILENLTYPKEARQAGFQGILKLTMRLAYTGQLLEVMVKDSSGYKVLDDNAVNIAKRISTFPPFPSTIADKELWIDVPIAYRLD